MKYLLTVIIVIVVAAVSVGLWFAGSPKQERMRRFDQMRVSHLQMIQSELYNYWNVNKKLPDSLAVFDGTMTNGWATFIPPLDPEQGTAYGYEKKDEDTFVLCATFVMKSEDIGETSYAMYPPNRGVPDSWAHEVGQACFERTFDKANWLPAVPPVK